MRKTTVDRATVERLVVPLLTNLTTADRDLLMRLFAGMSPTQRDIDIETALTLMFDEVSLPASLKFADWRVRLNAAAGPTGFTVSGQATLTFEVSQDWYESPTRGALAGHEQEVTIAQTATATTLGGLESSRPVIRLVGIYLDNDAMAHRLVNDLVTTRLATSKQFIYNPWLPSELLLGLRVEEQLSQRLEDADAVLVGLTPALLANPGWMNRVVSFFASGRPVFVAQVSPTSEYMEHGGLEQLRPFTWDGHAFGELDRPRRTKYLNGLFRAIEETLIERFQPRSQVPCPEDTDLRPLLGKPDETYIAQRAARAVGLSDLKEPGKIGREANEVDACQILDQWAEDPRGARYCVVLGEYGVGKTTLLRQFTQRRLDRMQQDRLPQTVLLDLRNALGLLKRGDPVIKLEPLIEEMLDRAWRATEPRSFDAQRVVTMVREEAAILIFDGLDEVLVHLSPEQGLLLIREFWSALPAHTQAKGAGRLVFSCRSTFFPTVRNQVSALTGQGRDNRADDYLALVLHPFTEDQIRAYLGQVLGTKAEAAFETIESVHNLRELAERPYLLKLISSEIGRLEQMRASGLTVRSVDLYDGFVEAWLLRENGKHRLSPRDKVWITEKLAAAMWAEGQREWTWPHLEAWLQKTVVADPRLAKQHLSTADAKALLHEVSRTATFVLRPDQSPDRFRFAHTSIQEYFLARWLVQALREGDAWGAWGQVRPSEETLAFVAEFLSRPEESRALRHLGEVLELAMPGASENAFRTWLTARQQGLVEPSPSRVDLSRCDLFGLKIAGTPERPFPLAGADLSDADLRCTEWRQVDLARAKLDGAQGYAATFESVRTDGASFDGFGMTGTVWRDAVAPASSALVWTNGPAESDAIGHVSFGHSDRSRSVSISKDGRWAISGSSDQSIIIWEVASGRSLIRLNGHTNLVTSVAISNDGKLAVSGSEDKTVVLWDVVSGAKIRTFYGHEEQVTSVTFSADGAWALSGSEDNTLILWEVDTGRIVRSLYGHRNSVTSIALSGDGKFAISGSIDKALILWQMDSGRLLRKFNGHSNWIRCVAFSPDSEFALSGSADHTLIYWHVGSGRQMRTFIGHSHTVKAVAFSPDGKCAVSGDYDGTLILWEAHTGEALRVFNTDQEALNSVCFSPDGKHVLYGSSDSALTIWDIESGKYLRRFTGQSEEVGSPIILDSMHVAVSGSYSQGLCLWEMSSGRRLEHFSRQLDNAVAVAVSSDDAFILSGYVDGRLLMHEISTGKLVRKLEGHSAPVTSLVFSSGGDWALSGSDDTTSILWEVSSGTLVRTFRGHTDSIVSVALSGDGTRALTSSKDRSLCLWEVATGNLERQFEGHNERVLTVAFSRAGRYALSGAEDCTVILWEVLTGNILRRLVGHTSSITSVALSKDGTWALSSSLDHTMIMWDLKTGQPIQILRGPQTGITGATISPDGLTALSTSADGTLVKWDLTTGQPIWQTLHAPDGERAVIDLQTKKFTYLEPGAWRRVHAVGPDPVTGRLRTYPPEAAMAE